MAQQDTSRAAGDTSTGARRARRAQPWALIAAVVAVLAVIALLSVSRSGTGTERGSEAPATARAMPGGPDAGRAGTIGTPEATGSGPTQRVNEG